MSLFSVSFARMFSKKTQPYQVINSDPAVSSSEDCSASDRASYDGLLEKEWPLQRRRLSIWRRYYKLIIAHIVLFILYCATIYTVATHRPKDIRSVGLPFCEFYLLAPRRRDFLCMLLFTMLIPV